MFTFGMGVDFLVSVSMVYLVGTVGGMGGNRTIG